MKISVTSSEMVGPNAETPSGCMWLTNLDLVMPTNYHTRTVYFYRYDGGAAAANFFNPTVLKAALSRALVEFYPMAGRLATENGRITINCNGEGVLFVEAECDGEIDDMGDFAPKPELDLTPAVDYSLGISTFPLSMMQVTRFKCGGVCLGIAHQHHAADGLSALHFINTWSDLSRGLDKIAVPPFLDRTVLRARVPPHPMFPHTEYHRPTPTPTTTTASASPQPEIKYSFFKLTSDHLKTLKSKVNDDDSSTTNYSTYEVLAAHVWRCVTTARNLPENQQTKLYVSTDGRSRLRPPPPPGYFGNVIFSAAVVANGGEIGSNGVGFAAGKIRGAIARMDDEYLRSAIDYLEMKSDVIGSIALNENTYKWPNLGIISWIRLPIYGADFGWGEPVYMGPARPSSEGKCHLLPNNTAGDGSLLVAISLLKEHMLLFEKLLYQI